MALNFGAAQGDFLPFLKYNAKAGRFYKKEGDSEVEVQSPVFVADFANIKTGWFFYAEGMAPNVVFDESLTQPAAKPSDKHKRGFKVNIFSKTIFDGGVAEFASASMHACAAMNDLYTQYEAAANANVGKVAVVKCTGATPMKDKMGTNYRPVFTIEKWVARPVELDAPTTDKPVAATTTQAAPAATVSATSEF